jgi:hypothetical protein
MGDPCSILPSADQALQGLLEEFAAAIGYKPTDARVVSDLSELPLCLQVHARQCSITSWRSWRTDTYIWFIEAMPFTLFGSQTALEVLFYSQDGAAVAAGVWSRNDNCHWQLRYVLEPEHFLETRHARVVSDQLENSPVKCG